jgi:CheY-like chemotaxis protein
MNIIIVDDDPLVVESLKTIINANGINILAVGYGGLEAVELFNKYRPDLILMDIRMENMNGIEATREISR